MKIKEIVSELLIEAIKVKASDIFFFPKKENLMVKFRTGKGLIEYAGFTLETGKEIINFLSTVLRWILQNIVARRLAQ